MSDFVQGALLAQMRLVSGVNDDEVLITATLDTEVMVVMASPLTAAGVAVFSLFHDDAGQLTTPPYPAEHAVLSEFTVNSANQGPILAAQSISGGIHLRPGGQLAASLISGPSVTLSVYGITASLSGRDR